MSAASLEVTLPDGSRRSGDAILTPWTDRAKAARKARRPYEGQWMTNQAFAAGKQWAVYQPRQHRVLEDPKRKRQGRSMQTANMLTQYLWTAIGKLAADDFRPELLFTRADEEAETYAKQANLAYGWGWDEEWKGDETLLDVLHTLAVFGTAAVRCRYDRTKGPMLGDVPYAHDGGHSYQDQQGQQVNVAAGKPILDQDAARAYVADRKYYGEPIDFRPLREGAIVWEVLSPWNLLPQPGIEHARDFTWEIIVRPVALETLKEIYGARADGVQAQEIEAMSLLGMKELTSADANAHPQTTESYSKLTDHALVYTGYQKPNADYPKGQRVVWAGDEHLLDASAELLYQGAPYGPRSGITYFRYWPIKQRFFGMGLIEPGIGPQRRRNKRSSQMDDIIDRAMPKSWAEEGSFDPDEITGNPLEVVWLKPGSSKPLLDPGIGPGAYMKDDIVQCDTDMQRALGINEIGLGNAPAGVSAYSAMALISENDSQKLNPIAQRFKLGIADLGRDTFEAMRNWPDGKQLLIAGEDDTLQTVVFERAMLPAAYYVRPAKGGTLPRSQASEIQKIADLWNAATVAGVVAQAPQAWIEWYKSSLDEGTSDELPRMDQTNEQRHKAALENIVMVRTGQPVPVAPYDDPQVHIPEHDDELMNLQSAADYGDTDVASAIQAIEAHKQMHLQMAQQNAAQMQATAPPAPGVPGDGGQPFVPPAQYENTLQTPRLPRVGNNYGFR